LTLRGGKTREPITEPANVAARRRSQPRQRLSNVFVPMYSTAHSRHHRR
jgi:hypothetical protein